MSKHEKFILTPITTVLEEMITSTSGVNGGIETYSLWDYILQATFTKMTGFQEQKIKCIDWELATNGFDYRISFIEEVKNRGTYSTYDAKKAVYNALVNEILRYSGREKDEYIQYLKSNTVINPRVQIQTIIEKSHVIDCKRRDYDVFMVCDNEFKNQYFVLPTTGSKNLKLFENILQSHYEGELYSQRNRIAHNTLSYQQNLPDMNMLRKENGLSRNYFFWFSILYLIDEIFMVLYKDYSMYIKEDSYFEE